MKRLIVVDMQNDFINGSLGSKDAEAIVPAVEDKIRRRALEGASVIFTLDTHGADYFNTREGRLLPVAHCVEGTSGHLLGIAPSLTESGIKLKKTEFGTLSWKEYAEDGDDIELVGLCTDICVVTNALILRTMFPNSKITVDSSACAGTSKACHEAALTVMRACQIEVS